VMLRLSTDVEKVVSGGDNNEEEGNWF